MNKILIYQDYVHNNGVLFKSLSTLFPEHIVTFCDATDILGDVLDSSVSLFVMPGGADLYYCEKLNGEGNKVIRKYVEDGGNYLGICAGAYYACREIEWGKDTNQEIIGKRELNFVDCKAVGPIYEFIEDGDIEKSWDNITTIEMDGESFTTLYRAGPIFSENENVEVLARYSNLPKKPPAITLSAVGKGNVLLSSPHIEFNSETYNSVAYGRLNSSYKWQKSVAEKYQDNDNQSSNGLLATLLKTINI